MSSATSLLKRYSLIAVLFLITQVSFAQTENDFFEISGVVEDVETKKQIPQTGIRIKDTNIGTISNSDGEFSLKIPNEYRSFDIEVAHLGYISKSVPISKITTNDYTISLQPVAQDLDEINLTVFKNASDLVKKTFEKKAANYSEQRNLLTSFYRETIKRRRQNVSLSEAVVNLYKQSYDSEKIDFIKLIKSRKDTDYRKLDTVALKLQGGPYNTLYMDVVKYAEYVFDMPNINNYEFSYDKSTEINDQVVYVVNFLQKPTIKEPLYHGKLFINSENYALVRATYSLNLENKKEVISYLVKKKPIGVKIEPLKVDYQVDYTFQNGKWFYNYSKSDLSFRVKRKRKLFNSVYTLSMEMAVTDRNSIIDELVWTKRDRLKKSIVLADEASGFSDPQFWGSYNVIEPEKSIESAIQKIRKKLEKLN